MSATAAVSQADLAADADIFSALSAMTMQMPKPAITAKWAPIRISPNLATGEILNVGVCVLHRRKVHVKLLPNAAPFEALYGGVGKENFSFLLGIIGQYLSGQKSLSVDISPQVSLGKPYFVAGDSIPEILDRLYTSMVSLELMCQKKETPKERNISTETLRHTVHSLLKKENAQFVENSWHDADNPIIIPSCTASKASIRLQHLQLWSEPDITNDKIRFASFVSADYIKTLIGDAHLFYAKQDIELAVNYKDGEKEAGLFVYRPKGSSADIDNTIDHTYWLLKKNTAEKATFRMEVEDDIHKLARHAHAFIA
ncbi:hypothetical protein [Neisseria shayeganii]|uniref:Uncharacterized protein n=1 Tax=Neisseria shayeganii 871 TaxID=1032488 RepID=G4CG67_9NEIS|nr:hypothetical protein [Neisseria shayeganii]EGY53115.1 hypothetical protein HMPREF9371_0606 [Neisseria shayeganii 871]